MKPEGVVLSRKHKLKALYRTLRFNVNWQWVSVIIISMIIAGVFVTLGTTPSEFSTYYGYLFARFIMFTFSTVIISTIGFVSRFIYQEELVPLFKEINKKYESESLEIKKEVLANVIEDTILKDGK